MVGILLTVPIAAVVSRTDAAGLAWAAVPGAGFAGWRLGPSPLGPDGNRRVLQAALAFGLLVAFGGVLVSTIASMLASLLPGSTVARPETPFGYMIFLLLTLVSMTPLIAIPAGIVGLVWAGLVRRIKEPGRA
jgi:hypothetical protein